MRVLALNAGSSTIKAAVYEVGSASKDGDRASPAEWAGAVPMNDGAIDEFLRAQHDAAHGAIDVIGHRIVHGGAELTASTILDSGVHDAIARVAEYAPLHNRVALDIVDRATRIFGESMPQVAVFDTAFHATLPAEAYAYAGPFVWLEQGLRKYGFHGISHRYASRRAARILGAGARRIVTCHLGSGCSLAAVHDGVSVDTTMGMTPTDGVPMATRSGSVDPGLLIHLLRSGANTTDSLDDLLNHHAGLAGLSGTDGDMRVVLAAVAAGSERARLAFDVYIRRIAQGVATMSAAMNGIDALAFTGGTGEHAPQVRSAICARLDFLGIDLDVALNAACVADEVISASRSRVGVVLVGAEENWCIAQDCWRVLASRTPSGQRGAASG